MKVALLGYGTVGKGCADALKNTGIEIKRVLDLRDIPEIADIRTENLADILEDEEIGIVAELIGGEHPAFEFVRDSLLAGKHVVTANKQMLSLHYEEITGLAKSRGLELSFSATAGGGIPWLVNLARMASVDEVESVYGVMNGTTNFILDAMQSKDQSYEEALKEAQSLGYAEADPTADVMGYDVRAKLAISCNIAFGGVMDPLSIPTTGITQITPEDVKRAREAGKVIRLIGSAVRQDGRIEAEISPRLVGPEHPTFPLKGAENVFCAQGKLSGTISYRGMGAGRGPTGANVAEDILNIWRKNA